MCRRANINIRRWPLVWPDQLLVLSLCDCVCVQAVLCYRCLPAVQLPLRCKCPRDTQNLRCRLCCREQTRLVSNLRILSDISRKKTCNETRFSACLVVNVLIFDHTFPRIFKLLYQLLRLFLLLLLLRAAVNPEIIELSCVSVGGFSALLCFNPVCACLAMCDQ